MCSKRPNGKQNITEVGFIFLNGSACEAGKSYHLTNVISGRKSVNVKGVVASVYQTPIKDIRGSLPRAWFKTPMNCKISGFAFSFQRAPFI